MASYNELMKALDKKPFDHDLGALALRLARASGATRIYLFGSHARSEATPDSDIDLGFVFPKGVDTFKSLLQAQRLIWPRDRSYDMVPLTEEDLREQKSPLAREVAREGIVLYREDEM